MLIKIIYIGAAVICCLPVVPAGVALFLGIILALAFGNPFLSLTKNWSKKLLQISIIGLGAGMQLQEVIRAGSHGFVYTVAGIFLTLCAGFILSSLLRTEKEAGLLISVGTAICGGSAIAAVSSAIKAKNESVTVALGTVFSLNAIALFIFPEIGKFYGLSAQQFGLWSAIAIHDTSSVVGAAIQFGGDAVSIAAPVKLARALWIIPLTFYAQKYWTTPETGDQNQSSASKPWFIVGFLLVAAAVSIFPVLQPSGQVVAKIAKQMLVFTLFLIGSGLTFSTLKSVGFRPLLQAVLLWILVSIVSLFFIIHY